MSPGQHHSFSRQSFQTTNGNHIARIPHFVAHLLALLLVFTLLFSIDITEATDTTTANGQITNSKSMTGTASLTNSTVDKTNVLNVLDDKYHLTIGDQLSYRVVEDEDDPKALLVTDSGELEVPYLGRFPAAGKTCKELAQDLKSELEKKYYWKATVIIAVDLKPRSRGKIYLAGAVGVPGPQDISSDETLTVSRAILRAGGLTSIADGNNVKITRSGGQPAADKKFTVNVARIIEKGKADDDMQLQPGDFIFVPDRMIRF